eukprot:4317180-Lingulodinium_polyedra.AAC.1
MAAEALYVARAVASYVAGASSALRGRENGRGESKEGRTRGVGVAAVSAKGSLFEGSARRSR